MRISDWSSDVCSSDLILHQDFKIARGAGHHSVVNVPGTDDWYIVYHRRPLGDDRGEHREMAIDKMVFRADGTIAPVKMTNACVQPRPFPRSAATRGECTEDAQAPFAQKLRHRDCSAPPRY